MGIYRQLYDYIKQGKPVVMLSEAKNGSISYNLYSSGEQMPKMAAEAWEQKEVIWKQQEDGWQKAEFFCPPVKLYLLGAGHISHALAQAAALVDLPVVVIDDRPDFANTQRFPQAEEVICKDFLTALSEIEFNPSSFVVTATRGHRYDQDCLEVLLKEELAYIGMVGSKRRVRGLKKNLQEMGIPEHKVARLHSPIGMDIKAKTPAEIAISILAEIIREKRTIFPAEEADREVLEQAQAAESSGEGAVLCTIVDTRGSSPRKAGAKMLVYPDGRITGTIGGGCGEAEVKREALNVFFSGKPAVYRLDMTAEAAAEDGMACGGIMRVLLEPLGVKNC